MGVYSRPSKRARVIPEAFHHSKLGGLADFYGPFRTNIKSFLSDLAQPLMLHLWCIQLIAENSEPFKLFIVEEQPLESGALHCDHCRIIGWKNHPVCRSRYHFIVPASGDDLLAAPYDCCADGSCQSRGHTAPFSSVLQAQTHLLHGVLHSNGYGHLLRVNGREGGSKLLSGSDIMDLWDHLCTMLRARKVSVLDLSKRFGLDYRLMHAIGKGASWYGTWGYKFARGSFGVTEAEYKQAVNAMASLPLKRVEQSDRDLQRIIRSRQRLSEPKLRTLRDLVRHLLELARNLQRLLVHSGGAPQQLDVLPLARPKTSERWPVHRLDKTFDVLVGVLKEHGVSNWVPREELRRRAHEHVRDRGLLDHSLCSFVGRPVGGDIVVQRRTDSRTRHYEYRLAYYGDAAQEPGLVMQKQRDMQKEMGRCARELQEVLEHLNYVYNYVLLGKLGTEEWQRCARVILDSKHLVKDYRGNLVDEGKQATSCRTRIQCKAELVDEGKPHKQQQQQQAQLQQQQPQQQQAQLLQPQQQQARLQLQQQQGQSELQFQQQSLLQFQQGQLQLQQPQERQQAQLQQQQQGIPSELLLLPKAATVGELKAEVCRAFREVYPCFEGMRVVCIPVLEGEGDEAALARRVGGAALLTVRVDGVDGGAAGRFERGPDEWRVQCACGAADDDGERMAQCDTCSAWAHTRCSAIPDHLPPPPLFTCPACSSSVVKA